MKILVVSNTPWRNDNSFGNSYSNIFAGIKDAEIANIFCKYGNPSNNIVSRYFQITEKSLMKNLKNASIPSGKEVYSEKENAVDLSSAEQNYYNSARKRRWMVMFWVRDFIWTVGRWKSKELKDFVDDFKPDIIFQPVYYSTYLNKIACFIKDYADVPMVGYISDDCYTLRQFSLSPLYWIDRLIKRRKVKMTIDNCEHLYVISDIQKREYEKCFNIKCKILCKMDNFYGSPKMQDKHNIPLKIAYTGNIGAGRWESLALIAEALDEINQDGKKAELEIYTLTPLTKKMDKALNIDGSSKVMGSISAEEAIKIQENADVLVHVESFRLKHRLAVHQSFSTKIVDYLAAAKCIFAVGASDAASIDYLIKNDAAIVAQTKDEVINKLRKLVSDHSILSEYSVKAWKSGKRNHQKNVLQAELYNDLCSIVEGSKKA